MNFQFKPTPTKIDYWTSYKRETPFTLTLHSFQAPLSLFDLPSLGMSTRYTNPSDHQPPTFNGSYPPLGEEIPTDFTSFFHFGDTPPPSPSKVKTFFGSFRNRARSNPDTDGDFKPRQRSRTSPFEDKNKLKVLFDSWSASSKSKDIDDALLITEDVPPVPKLPEVLKPPRIHLKPLTPINIEGSRANRGAEHGLVVDVAPQNPHQHAASSPIRSENLKPKASLTSPKSYSPSRRTGLADATNSPRSPGFKAVAPPAASPVRHVPSNISTPPGNRNTLSPTGRFYAQLPTPLQRGSSLDGAGSYRSGASNGGFRIRAPTTIPPPVEPLLRGSSGGSTLDVYRPQLEPLPPISPFGVNFPGPNEVTLCVPGGTGHLSPPTWTRSSVDPVRLEDGGDMGKRVENDTSNSPDLHKSEEGDLTSDLSMWWGSEGAYYYDTRVS